LQNHSSETAETGGLFVAEQCKKVCVRSQGRRNLSGVFCNPSFILLLLCTTIGLSGCGNSAARNALEEAQKAKLAAMKAHETAETAREVADDKLLKAEGKSQWMHSLLASRKQGTPRLPPRLRRKKSVPELTNGD
jgi:hypothetical protein